MLRVINILLLAATLVTAFAHADDTAPDVRKPVQDPDNLYVGVGMFNDMLNLNVETITPWGNFLFRGGRFKDLNEGFAANVSWRQPLNGDPHASDYYLGVFAGQVVADAFDGENVQRLGGGAEMGYHWVSDYTRAEITVGMGAAESLRNVRDELPMEPTLFLSFNMALGY